MTFEEIRDWTATAMHHHPNWANVLDNTNPGHYGVEDIEFEVALADIWVDMVRITLIMSGKVFTGVKF